MKIEGSVALVTGANRGIGNAIALALLENGAAKVYAGARKPETITDPRLTPVKLDVTNPDDIAAVAGLAQDVRIVVNNAGMGGGEAQLLSGPLSVAREVMETNLFGPWEIARAFAPMLAGGALVNVLSVSSWWAMASAPAYSASKAAAWSLTNALRVGLPETLVVGVHSGFVDTEFSAWTSAPKITAADLAAQTVKALLENRIEVLADEFTTETRAALSGDLDALQAVKPY
ncbi:short-chain dehydrogenase [Lentzea aerocolonigenes]|uniref:Short-chain dehydrogenase n=1 Tax=Lentzea aerocolonigenes TaxID=68170 RepID=A0A0F0GQM1_LENAE|nr:SDR family NAD(P)-dependent oxidoreductase [Lentzea aerocolonigenes]KJK45610.1 short-chain dehydrogenase [Lentzea aerocolonigenes]